MKSAQASRIVLTVAFLAVIFVEPLGQVLLELGRGSRPQVLELFTRVPVAKNLRDFEAGIEDQSWSAQVARPAMQHVRYVLGGDLGAKALEGREGWLFYRPGVDFLVEPWTPGGASTDDPLPAILHFRDALAARGIELLVMMAPGKPSVYPDKLSVRAEGREAEVHAHATQFLERLRTAGVHHVDLFTAYAQAREAHEETPLYLAHDTHWSPEGVRLAARLVAGRVLEEGWIPQGTQDYGERLIAEPRGGDILRMVGVPAIAAHFTPQRVECRQIIDAVTGAAYEDNPQAPVLVLGDSFLRMYQRDDPRSAGFIAHLARELKQPLASIVSDGGASTLVRQELARKPELLENKKLVIWEFVERDLRFGMEGWQKVDL